MTNNQYEPFAENLKTIVVNGAQEWLDERGLTIPDQVVFDGWLEAFIDIYSELGLSPAIMSFEISSTLFRSLTTMYEPKIETGEMTADDWADAIGSANSAIAIGLILKVTKPLQI